MKSLKKVHMNQRLFIMATRARRDRGPHSCPSQSSSIGPCSPNRAMRGWNFCAGWSNLGKSELHLRTTRSWMWCWTFFPQCCRIWDYVSLLTDARENNIVEARSRHPGIDFRVADAEGVSLATLGTVDLVICFGLLYHLENPLGAIRNLHALTGKLLVLESMSVPEEQPFLFLQDEPPGRRSEPSRHQLLSIRKAPSSRWPTAQAFPMCTGFELPNHEDFRAPW